MEAAGEDNKRSSPAGSTIKGTKHTFGGTRQTKQEQERNVKKNKIANREKKNQESLPWQQPQSEKGGEGGGA